MTRQRRYQLAHQRDGLCETCPEVAYLDGRYCKKHRRVYVLRKRDENRSKPWRKGKRGRPPLEVTTR